MVHKFAKQSIHNLLSKLGFQLRRIQDTRTPLEVMLQQYAIDCVFDIGANTGQSIEYFRRINYFGRIVAFEPVSHLYQQLVVNSRLDSYSFLEHCALGAEIGEARINVSGGHGGSSSLREMTHQLRTSAPDQVVVRHERVPVRTIDWAATKYYPQGERLFVKLDVQGSERDCLAGAMHTLPRVAGIKMEMSLVENYVGETLLVEVLPWLYSRGFFTVSVEEAWRDPISQELYQVDVCLFRRATQRALTNGDDASTKNRFVSVEKTRFG